MLRFRKNGATGNFARTKAPVSWIFLLISSVLLMGLSGLILLAQNAPKEASLYLSSLLWVVKMLSGAPAYTIISIAVVSSAIAIVGSFMIRMNLQEKQQVEARLKAAEHTAREEHERAAVALGSITDAVLCLSKELKITYLNQAAEGLIGCSAESLLNEPIFDVLRFTNESDVSAMMIRLVKALSGGQFEGSLLGVMIKNKDGSTTAINERIAPMKDEKNTVIGVVLVLRDVTEERNLTLQLQHQARHDALTGLLNRAGFELELQQVLNRKGPASKKCALLYFDLDQFKIVNDTCGHAAGDALIHRVGWLIKEQLRETDVIARLGGDEFGAILLDVEENKAKALAERVARAIDAHRFKWEDRCFSVSSSIGVLIIEETMTPSEAMAAADQACYLAKDDGRNRVRIYRPKDLESRHEQMNWTAKITEALEENRFMLYAQRIAPLANNDIPGHYEILLRMQGPHGVIAPGSFIPSAERYGLMTKIDRWVIANTCKKAAALLKKHGAIPTYLINLSGTSVTDPELPNYIKKCLEESALPAASIGFELTETTAVSNLESAAKLMRELKTLGCRIVLDDFGSGMSSFTYLKALPVDSLKIDGAFVRGITTDNVDLTLIEAMQKVAHALGISTVAECVENAEALEMLAKIGVNFAQGFHIHRPAPLEYEKHAEAASVETLLSASEEPMRVSA